MTDHQRPARSLGEAFRLIGVNVTDAEVAAIAEDVKANAARLNGCKAHTWHPLKGARLFGPLPRRFVCAACLGQQESGKVAEYLRGLAVNHPAGYTYETLLERAVKRPPLDKWGAA